MTQPDFTAGLEAELRRRGAAFSRAEVQEFAEAVWSLALEDPDPVRWVDAFVESRPAAARRCPSSAAQGRAPCR
jgi:hypothetical protein